VQEIISLLPSLLTGLFTAAITWFFARRKTNAEAKSAEIDAEIKSADFYRGLLDDATRRLNEAIDTIKVQDVKIKTLMLEIETLTIEIRKYKQLNGKTE
jgi:hypothetical protein